MHTVTLSGPTTLYPLIYKAIEYAKEMPNTHILCFILCDGDMCCPTLDC